VEEQMTDKLSQVLERYRGRNLVLAIDGSDGETVLAEASKVPETVAMARATGKKFFLVYSPPAEGTPPMVPVLDVGMALTEVRSFVRIAEDASLQAKPGDFGAKLEERTLHLASATVAALVDHQIRSAEDFLSFIHGFPTHVAVAMRWQIDDVSRARDALCGLLRGVVSAAFTDSPEPIRHPLGAFPLARKRVDVEESSEGRDAIAIEQEFAQLAADWRRDCHLSSSLTVKFTHPAYERIIAMGWPVVPVILRELQCAPDHWSWALRMITGEDPVPAAAKGQLPETVQAWLVWGRERGLIS
jgi:hypothetical protein